MHTASTFIWCHTYNHHSIVVMDNASIHHVPSIENTGTLVQFLPPYSPDFNWHSLKLKIDCKSMDCTIIIIMSILF